MFYYSLFQCVMMFVFLSINEKNITFDQCLYYLAKKLS